MGRSVHTRTTSNRWAEAIAAKVCMIADELGVKAYKLTDINCATSKRLQSLTGSGALCAKKIVQGRPYQQTEDLVTKQVLSQEAYDRMKDQIVVTQP
jgi:DNA uptake protein ComE-like DNA-binding protein